MDVEPALITIEEAARVLRISRAKAYQLAARGELPGVLHVGHSMRVSKTRLFAWIDDQARRQPA